MEACRSETGFQRDMKTCADKNALEPAGRLLEKVFPNSWHWISEHVLLAEEDIRLARSAIAGEFRWPLTINLSTLCAASRIFLRSQTSFNQRGYHAGTNVGLSRVLE